MNKRIAILSNHYSATVTWIKHFFEIEKFDIRNNHFTTKDGNTYYIISYKEQALGMDFDSYIKAPDYESLEDVVRQRITR